MFAQPGDDGNRAVCTVWRGGSAAGDTVFCRNGS